MEDPGTQSMLLITSLLGNLSVATATVENIASQSYWK